MRGKVLSISNFINKEKVNTKNSNFKFNVSVSNST